MKNFTSTYRIQFHKDFTFLDFERVIPYLDKLGINTIYASPIFEAVPESPHGYDVVNPLRINPEIGTEDQLRTISQELKSRGMYWLQDIVPNHMAFHPANGWLMDVLNKGQRSPYARFFDINWTLPYHQERLMVPFLSDSLENVCKSGDLQVAYQNQRLAFTYNEAAYPLHLRSYTTILQAGTGGPGPAIQTLVSAIADIEAIEDAENYALLSDEFYQKLAFLLEDSGQKKYLQTCLKAINSDASRIQQVSDEQAYRLCYYGETNEQINYRRFFTVSSMICLNIQDPVVFEQVHAYTKKLLEEGIFHGLRIDHIDGLYDPNRYLEQLRKLAGEETYIIVEKILEQGEGLPQRWPIQGATGYQFLSLVNNLLTQTKSQQTFTKFYRKLLGEAKQVHEELHNKKEFILYEYMQGELDNLYTLFLDLNLVDTYQLEAVSAEKLKAAIAEFLIRCPVYRYYGNQMPLSASETNAVQDILTQISTDKPTLKPATDLLCNSLLSKPKEADEDYNNRVLRFYQRCMQFTGPLMAKGVEDTLMYTYNRFLGHDEVGDSPEFFGMTIDEFHQSMVERQKRWPLALNATATHDTKRGEDVRSRLNVLTDMAEEWTNEILNWQSLDQTVKAPDRNDAYFIYQTLVGAHPMPGLESRDDTPFADRLMEYLQKALREAKRHSTHDAPNEEYEKIAQTFARQLLDQGRPFWGQFFPFYQQIADFGIINSLAQVVLKCTCPGIPDVYQGSELWDLSLVDPDNRRPVDFDLRRQGLDELLANSDVDCWADLWKNRYNARIKLWLLHILLTERQTQIDLFREGIYIPLTIEGRYKQHVMAFARHHEQIWYVVAIPLGIACLCQEQKTDPSRLTWGDTQILLPPEAPTHWQHRFLDTKGRIETGIVLEHVFSFLPMAVLKLSAAED
ncbi:malto-oligosyltrehalose synthase [Spirosoma harenae]